MAGGCAAAPTSEVAWALSYTFYSFTKTWGDDPNGYFFGEVLKAGDPGVTLGVRPRCPAPTRDRVGLAFIAFPTIVNEAPAGALIGVLEVVVSAVRDKFEMSRIRATLVVTVPCAIISVVGFSTTSGIYVLDILDHFINWFGILLVAVVSMLVLAWVVRAPPRFMSHLNRDGSVPIGRWWVVLVAAITPWRAWGICPLGRAIYFVMASARCDRYRCA